MIPSEEQIVAAYCHTHLSEKQISDKFLLPPKQVRKILDNNHVARRSRSEAAGWFYKTSYSFKDFCLKEDLTREEELLKISGVMLYWGEGTKDRGTVALSNSNPDMIALFLRFLRVICGVDENRVHATVHYYKDHDISLLTRFWADVASLSESQFYKPYLHLNRKGTYKKPSLYGTISIQYSDKKLLKVILNWISEYKSVGL